MPGRLSWRKEKTAVMPRPRKYPIELLERATRLVFESHAARGMRPLCRCRLLCRAWGESRGGVR